MTNHRSSTQDESRYRTVHLAVTDQVKTEKVQQQILFFLHLLIKLPQATPASSPAKAGSS